MKNWIYNLIVKGEGVIYSELAMAEKLRAENVNVINASKRL